MATAETSSRTLRLRIITREQVLLDTEVVSVRLPGAGGYFGVLPRHAPMVALTASGLLKARGRNGEERSYVIHDGFAEVGRDAVTVLTRSAEAPAEIDLERARRAAERARERLHSREADVDLARATAALERALARELYAHRPL
ncbi:MAG: ATP synthase F1 subunit epsilon [Planctomycetota bacterium]|nr:MAG: ATP synthase F1 subunit epsilon [Planctomycetota bacterium]